MAFSSSVRWGSLFGACVVSFALPAAAHISLLEPAPRYTGSENKSCPCGAGLSNRLCDVERDGSDPARSSNVTTFEVGSTITVRFSEYVDHAGRFRIAFDADGADVADFNANVLLDVPDPGDVTSNTADGLWEFEVTLPETPCENCTLQLVQAMHGDTENPVPDPSDLSSYYTCADISLVPAGELPTSGAGGSNTMETAGSGETTTAATAGDATPADADSEGGCACDFARPRPHSPLLTALGLVLIALRRRLRLAGSRAE